MKRPCDLEAEGMKTLGGAGLPTKPTGREARTAWPWILESSFSMTSSECSLP